jgi:hypothetical protein
MDRPAEEHENSRPEKRQRLVEGAVDAEHSAHVTVEDADGPPAGPPPAEQLTAALKKIANHISNSAKFSKASQLLRQVMDAVDKSHRYSNSLCYSSLTEVVRSCSTAACRLFVAAAQLSVGLANPFLSCFYFRCCAWCIQQHVSPHSPQLPSPPVPFVCAVAVMTSLRL